MAVENSDSRSVGSLEELVTWLVEKIEYEEGVKVAATLEMDMHSTQNDKKRNRWRDVKRAESKIRAFEEVLDEVLPATGWQWGVKRYMAEHTGVI